MIDNDCKTQRSRISVQSTWSHRLGLSLAVIGVSLISACSQSISPSKEPEVKAKPQATTTAPQRFDGTTVNFVALKYPIGNAFEARAKEFEAMTGAKIVFKPAAFGDLYDVITKDHKTKANQYDVIVYTPLWLPDLVNANYLADITDRVNADPALQWDDITPFYQQYSGSYNNKIYGLPVDGDYYMLYYRSDLLEAAGLKPPSTWDEYLTIAKHFHGKDLNGDDTPDYGSCLPKSRNHVIGWALWSIASSFLQTQGTSQGGFFDPDTMKPLIKNEAFAKALEIYKKTGKYGPPDELNHTMTDARERFIDGRCALTLDHGNTGTLTFAKGSKVVDKVGTSMLPGSTEVLDRKTGKLVACDKFTCPYGVNGVNHAPYAALIGWTAGINAAAPPKVQAAAYAFISYVSQPAQSNVDVTVGDTGFNPYRISQFSDNEIWIKAGMSATAANKYLGGIGTSLNNPNMMMDMTIPNNNGYQQKILDSAVADFLADQISLDQAITTIDTGWETLTDKMGRSSQKAVYRTQLGLTP